MPETRNLVLAVLISALVLGSWYYFVDLPRIQAMQKREQQSAHTMKGIEKSLTPQVEQFKSREEAMKGSHRVRIKSEFLHGSILLKGLRLDDLTLAQFHETVDDNSPEVALLSPSGTEGVYFAEFGWLAGNDSVVVPDAETVWQSSGNELTPKTPLTFSWSNPQGVKFIIKLSLDEHYMFTIEQEVQNNSGKTVTLHPYGLINRAHKREKEIYISHIGPVGFLEKTLQEVNYSDLQKKGKVSFEQTSGWLGIGDKYWLTALIPANEEVFDATFSSASENKNLRYQVDYLGTPKQVLPGKKQNDTIRFFAGAKKVGLLDTYTKELNIPFFDRAVDFGWLYFLTKPFFKALQLFYKFFGNFGIAILTLTVIIKALMFPLANKSYRSMNQMKELAPEITRLRQEHQNDKMRLNQEIMDFYKRKKINPMAGCLPILVQIPIFFALYKVLYITIEMRHAPFYGWIHDLSAPDPTTLFNLFGLLPYDVPHFLHIGVWPLLMSFTMYIQQSINPPPADPVQAKIMRLLPFIFLMLFASFPAGLVIYWTWSNSLSILQQRLLAGGLKKAKAKAAKG